MRHWSSYHIQHQEEITKSNSNQYHIDRRGHHLLSCQYNQMENVENSSDFREKQLKVKTDFDHFPRKVLQESIEKKRFSLKIHSSVFLIMWNILKVANIQTHFGKRINREVEKEKTSGTDRREDVSRLTDFPNGGAICCELIRWWQTELSTFGTLHLGCTSSEKIIVVSEATSFVWITSFIAHTTTPISWFYRLNHFWKRVQMFEYCSQVSVLLEEFSLIIFIDF